LTVQWRSAGQYHTSIAGYFAVGAYPSALLTAPPSETHVAGFELPVPLGILAAAMTAGITGWAVARICIRLKSDYLAMASIGIAEILRMVIVNEDWLTNGSLGITNIPRPFDGLVEGRAADILFLAVVWVIVAIIYIIC